MSDSLTHIKEVIVVLNDHFLHSQYGYAVYKAAHDKEENIRTDLSESIDKKSIFSDHPDMIPVVKALNASGPELRIFKYLYKTSLSSSVLTICRMMENKKGCDNFFDILKKAEKLTEKPARLNELKKKVDIFNSSNEFERLKKFRHEVLAHNAKYDIPSADIIDLEYCLDEIAKLIELSVEIFMNKTWHSQNKKSIALSCAFNFWNMLID